VGQRSEEGRKSEGKRLQWVWSEAEPAGDLRAIQVKTENQKVLFHCTRIERYIPINKRGFSQS